ncbi:hypothetical protein [Micromonospora sp. NPDC047730]|uniref:hypothetical protein n=1 Tax=Micromonospora sp. NPDC047730 TaxID=3364253 RepID=UPI003719A57C
MTTYGPEQPCARTDCVDEPPHKGGEHIDPRSPRYDGPGATFGALPHNCRRAAYALKASGAPVPEVVEMAREILRLRDQVAAVQVDRDRQVLAASKRALSCEAHGEQIAELEKQVDHFDRLAARNDRGRIALLALPRSIEELRADEKPPTIAALKKAARKVLDAHGRAWK